MKLLILTLMLSMLVLAGCGQEDCSLGNFLIMQNNAISKCASKSMSFVGIKVHAQNHLSVICKTNSPINYYEYPIQ